MARGFSLFPQNKQTNNITENATSATDWGIKQFFLSVFFCFAVINSKNHFSNKMRIKEARPSIALRQPLFDSKEMFAT